MAIQLETINTNTEWGTEASRINSNNQKIVSGLSAVDSKVESFQTSIQEAIDKADNINKNSQGYKSTIAKLKSDHPNPESGWYAYIGETGTIWEVEGGKWVDTGQPIPEDLIDLIEYLKKEDLNFQVFSDGDSKENGFIKIEFIENKSLSNDTGVELNNNFAHISNWMDVREANYIDTNNDRTIVFYDDDKNIIKVEKSINEVPALTDRIIDIRGKGYKFVRATIANEFVDSVYCYAVKSLSKDTGIPSNKVRHNGDKVSDILDGIGYNFGIDSNDPSENLFTDNVIVSAGRRHSDETGLGMGGYPDYSTPDAMPIEVEKGDTIVVNTNQTVVFYTEDKFKVYYFLPSLSTTPKQEVREIMIERDDVKYMSFTFLSAWGRNNMFVYKKQENKQLSGVPAKSIVHNNERLDNILDNLSAFDKGFGYGAKTQLSFLEEPGVVQLNGNVVTPSSVGTIAKCTTVLEKNSIYYIELKEIVSGQVNASVGGMPLIMAGRKTMWFRTDNRDNQELVLFIQGDLVLSGVPVLFDLRGKYKVYKIDEPAMAKSIMKLPAVASDLSAFPSAEIPEPQWTIWNVYGNYNNLTSTTDYSAVPCIVEYLDSNGYYFQKYAVVGGQGRTSMTFENHNSKYKLTNHDGSKFVLKIGDWLPRSTFHFKVNFSDFAQLNNPATASFITDWYRDADDPKFFYPWDKETPVDLSKVQLTRLYDRRPRGIIGAIPASIRTYWNHRSCGTMNLNAFAENFFLDDKNPLHRGFRGDTDHANKWRWEEMCSDTEGEEMSIETWTPFANWYTWMKTNSSSANLQTFKDADGVKYDKQNLIDSWLFAELCFLRDNLWANQVWISYDSEKYYYMWYDMDTAFGLSPVGQVDYKPTDDFKPNGSDQYLWTQVKRAYPTELAARYKELRDSGRFSVAKFREIYGAYQSRFNYEWFEMDFYTWKTRKSIQPGSFASLDRVLWFTEERIKFLDTKYGYTK